MGAIVRILPTLPEITVFEEEPEIGAAPQAPFAIEKEGDTVAIGEMEFDFVE